MIIIEASKIPKLIPLIETHKTTKPTENKNPSLKINHIYGYIQHRCCRSCMLIEAKDKV